MKRALILLMILAAPLAMAQTGAPPPSQQELLETVNILKGRVADLTDARDALQKQVQALQSKVDEMSAKLAKPQANYATEDEFKSLKAAIEEVDKKRQADNDNIVSTLKDIASAKTTAPTPVPKTHKEPKTDNSTPTPGPQANTPASDGAGFNYVAKSGDTLVKISKKLYTEQHIRISADNILKANAFLKGEAKNLKEGDTVFIPTPNIAGNN